MRESGGNDSIFGAGSCRSVQIDDRKDAIIEELLIATNKISVQMGYVPKAKGLAPTP